MDDFLVTIPQTGPLFLNIYACPHCEHQWRDVWDCGVDDTCPKCGTRNLSPSTSTEIVPYDPAEYDRIGRDSD